MIPSSAELVYFFEVANTLNLSRAAEKMSISQPSLSMAVKRLEESVGEALFIRHKTGVTLTPAGKHLLLHVKQLLQYWENTRTQAVAFHQEMQGSFILGCHSSITTYTDINKILPDLLEKNTQLEIHLKHDVSRNITEGVINSSIDIGIVANPIKHPDLIIQKLYNNDITFWTGPGNREIQNINSKKAIIICDPNLAQTQFLLKENKIRKIKYSRILTTNSLESVASLTANGCGIGILPACLAAAIYPEILKRVAKAPAYSDEICLIYRHEIRNIPAVKMIISEIKKLHKNKL